MCGKNTSGRILFQLVLSLADPMALCLQGTEGALGILLTFPQERMAFEGTIPEAAGTVPSESEKGEQMQIQDG